MLIAAASLGLVLGFAGCDDGGGESAAGPGPSAATALPSAAADCARPALEPTRSANPGAGTPGAGTGTLRGHLYGVGGPAPGVHEVWSGTITITGSTGEQRQAEVGPDGAYAVTLLAGHYDVAARSPHFNGCASLCHAPHRGPHDVVAGGTTTLDTYCSMK
jgi:hypothetical protein